MGRHDRAGTPLAALLLVAAVLLGGCSRGEGTGAAAAPAPVPAGTAAADATHGLDGVWVFAQGPAFPGPRYLRIDSAAGQPQGTLTTDWYGDIPMNKLRIVDGVAHFEIDNGNAKLPAKPWTATLGEDGLRVVGDIWSTHVDIVGRRGDAADAARLAFPPPRLPAWQPLAPDGLVQTPPMGWSSWNKFADRIDDATIRGIADAMVASGLRDAGYRYINIDDGWQGARDAAGVLQPNAHFPDMKALADYVHARGLKLGIYSSPGPKTCAGYVGSYGHVEQDARTWAGWGIDYVKYDLCSGEGIFRQPDEVRRAYLAMGQALRATGRPIVYSLCQYGRDQVGRWGRQVGGHLWRTTGDIEDRYEVMAKIGFEKNGDAADAGPGGFNDPDMLEVGNGGMSEDEYRTHMALWAMSAAPLLLGNDLRTMAPATVALLRNPALIAIDQDRLGQQGRVLRREGELELWRRPLAGGGVALAVFNRGGTQRELGLAPADAGGGTGADSAGGWRDAWTGARLRALPATVRVPAHGVVLFHRAPADASTPRD